MDKGTVNIGIATPHLNTPADKLYSPHTVLKEKGMIHMENVAYLDKVTGKRFKFNGFQLKIYSGTRSPNRAVAIIDVVGL